MPDILKICSYNLKSVAGKKYLFSLLYIILYLGSCTSSSQKSKTDLAHSIDSLISSDTSHLFSGTILVAQQGKVLYTKTTGYADRESKQLLQPSNQFIVGSVSKQFTAVIILREYDQGRIDLDKTIKYYLPQLTQGWADSVTVHHLLTHTHGIVAMDQPASFPAGSRMDYGRGNNIGYGLLAAIAEKSSGKSFAELSKELFNVCCMKHSVHPSYTPYEALTKGYSRQTDGRWLFDTASLAPHPAAGAFISTAADLVLWNQSLHGGKLLQPKTYDLMISKKDNAVRDHTIFGHTEYGYGITTGTSDKLLQLGQTGFTVGFPSMNYYFPKTGTSVVVLSNSVAWPDDLKKTFGVHVQILVTVRESIKQ